MSKIEYAKIKLLLTGDVRTVPAAEAKILVETKRAVYFRSAERETATKNVDAEKAVK